MKKTRKPVESHTLPGMSSDVDAQTQAAAECSGEQLTEILRRPLADVTRETRAMETDSPLFYGAIHPTLF